MQDGFIKVASITPRVRVADVAFNVESCLAAIEEAAGNRGAKVVVLPELCITGYTCEDLFWQDALLDAAERGLVSIAARTADVDALLLLGLPVRVASKLYNCAAVLFRGELLGLVPKRYVPMYNEFYEGRHFVSGPKTVTSVDFGLLGEVPFGTNQLFACDTIPELVVGAEICEDLWVPMPPSNAHAVAGATLICNLSASPALAGKSAYRRQLVAQQSARLICGYAYASAGEGESTTDLVFSGHNLVVENGRVLADSGVFGEGIAVSEIDVLSLAADRRRTSTFEVAPTPEDYKHLTTYFSLEFDGDGEGSAHDAAGCGHDGEGSEVSVRTSLTRFVDPHPFVPAMDDARATRCEEILSIQAHGLASRLAHTGSDHAVIGISGGLDSTLALLVTVRAFDQLGYDRSGIVAVTMPGFGTTDRTYTNAIELVQSLGADLREISIVDSVLQHFADIDHDQDVHDVVYENAQARERTQILMDVANQVGGMVIGTGDLSELALGWATYNGDQMSMYGVNASVPKTLVRYLVDYCADTYEEQGEDEIAHVLRDVLDTPVSPELLPSAADGSIEQKTEDLVGPYELHDFFLFHVLRHGSGPLKVLRLAECAFGTDTDQEVYDHETIVHWLKVFYRRFFSQQFKRSAMPDGPKVGSVSLSPRGDLRMPSDASSSLWLSELESLDS
ncbi:NAD(+) synthase [Lancefieldella parvula]|uniref:NAD(+) synthase n=1 Tax=Lancefieldella parvula TaxID=1382 RepID=UPI00290AD8EF|nr:NAD(+) synthase [Lancefieldella parvula]MDU4868668.1 NAD(+) synthase [Lancefieldella parvula]